MHPRENLAGRATLCGAGFGLENEFCTAGFLERFQLLKEMHTSYLCE